MVRIGLAETYSFLCLGGAAVTRKSGGRVMTGPFAGMSYVEAGICSGYWPKILGIYEREPAPLIERFCCEGFESVFDVGSAEGYYAVGMALRLKGRVTAFESAAEGRKLTRQMAERNGVAGLLEIKCECEVENLATQLDTGGLALSIMTVGGAEAALLDPHAIPRLARTAILVELHKWVSPGVGEELAARFQRSHTISEVRTRDRFITDLPVRWEFRPQPMSWFYFAPKA